MKLVIDIPNHVKNRLIFGTTYKDDLRIMIEALEKSTPLIERPKGKWVRVVDKAGHWVWECDCKWQQRFATNYCPDCGSYNGGDEDETSN